MSVDVGVIGMQDKATETWKTVILTTTTTKKKKRNKRKHYQITFEKKKFYVNSTEMYMAFACLLKSEHRACLIFIQPRACSVRYGLVSAQHSWPIRKQNHRKGINFYRCFDLLLHASCKTCCQNNATENHKSVVSVIKIRGIAILISTLFFFFFFFLFLFFCFVFFFFVGFYCVCFFSGLMWDSVTMHRTKQNSKMWKK